MLGICESCNTQFAADPHGGPAEAQAAIQQQFNAHKCQREEATESARESTKAK